MQKANLQNKRPAAWITGRCFGQFVLFLWCVGIGACFMLIVSQHGSIANYNHDRPTVKNAMPDEEPSSWSSNSNGNYYGNNHNKAKAKDTQTAWLQRKFKLSQKLGGQDGGGGFLPNWLLEGQDQVAIHQEPSNSNSNSNPYSMDTTMCTPSFNQTFRRPTHGCQRNKYTQMIHCTFQNFRVDNSFIQMDKGGEVLSTVMGRKESKEFPTYTMGAFSVETKPNHVPLPKDAYLPSLHYMQDVMDHMIIPNEGETKHHKCVETWKGTTMFLTRYEYVNLYHTMTDFWNTYFSLPSSPKDRKNVRIVFLDAHAQGGLDSVWNYLFGPTTMVQHLPKGGVCFETAILIPPGYAAPYMPQSFKASCPSPPLVQEFCQHVLKSYNYYGLQHVQKIRGKIVIIDRVPYISHPRSNPETAQRTLNNLHQLKQRLEKIRRVSSVEMVHLETMTFAEQLKSIREAHVLIGNHGAGLTHILFMDQGSHMIEFSSDDRDFFLVMSEWKGLEHSVISTQSEGTLDSDSIERAAERVTSVLGG
jgi:glycoprotein 2-beta-D-xylosyltransferase